MNYIYFCLLLFFSIIVVQVSGQNSFRPNIYLNNLNYYNPAAGLEDSLYRREISVYYKQKFVDNDVVWKKPANIFVNYLSKLGRKNNFYSLGYLSDNYSFYTSNRLFTGYTFNKQFNKWRSLSLGARALFRFNTINWEKVADRGNNSGKSSQLSPDFDLGAQYQGKNLGIGVSIKNLAATGFKIEDEFVIRNYREFFLNVSYAIRVGKFSLTPYTQLYYERGLDLDAGLAMGLGRKIMASYQFRIRELRSIGSLQLGLGNAFRLGAGFDWSPDHRDNNLDLFFAWQLK